MQDNEKLNPDYSEETSFLDELLDDPELSDNQNLALLHSEDEELEDENEEIDGNDENFNADEETPLSDTKPRKKRLSQTERQKKRINDMQSQMLAMQTELEKERLKALSYEEHLFKSKIDNLEKEEKYWKNITQDYKSSLESSYEEGASAAVADYTDKLQDSKLNLRQIQEEKNKIHSLYSQYKSQPPTPSQTKNVVVDEGLNQFLEKYPYLDPDQNNPNYSPDAFAEVSNLSAELSKQYKIQGRGHEISSEDYYEDLEKMMKKNTGLIPKKSTQPSSGSRSVRMVAPVGRRQSITHDDAEVAFTKGEKIKMNTLRNLFGKEHDELLYKTFSEAKRRR